VGDELELFNRVGIRLITDQVVRREVVVHAVQQKVVGFFAVAVHIGAPAAGGAQSGIEAGRGGSGGARRQQSQRYRVAADQRHVIDGTGRDHRADLGGVGLQNRSFTRYR